MDNSNFLTKGDSNFVLSRMGQVHTITMFCPLNDFGVQSLKKSLEIMLPDYMEEDNKWSNVPSIDAFNTFLFSSTFCENESPEYNKGYMDIINGSLRSFPKLKYINFVFTYDKIVETSYKITLMTKKRNEMKNIYKVDVLELNLGEMFTQDTIDFFNKILMVNDIMPNSYLDRCFRIDFNYDDYIGFMDMFLGNNAPTLNQYDSKVCDYFRAFPPVVEDNKPNIRVITNYSEL